MLVLPQYGSMTFFLLMLQDIKNVTGHRDSRSTESSCRETRW